MAPTRRIVLLAWAIAFCCIGGAPAGAADWPCYKADACRSGTTPETLEFPLSKAWVYRLPQPPRPAWPEPGFETHRADIDSAPQPVVAGGLVYLGSSADDTVRALNLSDGQPKWRFTTNGPVRFAPAVHRGKAYVASDDGHLYCLDAATGQLKWKFRGGPNDSRVIGNGRMISRWPLRSGVLVEEGVAYITAGMWPSEGIYVYALDAETGRALWCNDTSGSMYVKLARSGDYAMTGVSPQGYLLLWKNMLVVPTGRGKPAAYDSRTGRLLHPEMGRDGGGGGVWAGVDEETGLLHYGHSRGQPARIVLDLGTGERARRVGNHPAGRPHLASLGGETQLVGGEGIIAAQGKQAWRDDSLEGEVGGIAVADGRLVVTTKKGFVYCFERDRGKKGAAGPIVVSERPGEEVAGRGKTAPAMEILKVIRKSGITKGYAVILGRSDARLAEALAPQTELYLISLLEDKSVAAEQRRLVGTTNLYGSRISIGGAQSVSSLPPYFANVVVVSGSDDDLPEKELYRILRPCGGVMCFPGVGRPAVEALLRKSEVPRSEIRSLDASSVVVRGKLSGAFDWNSEVACDHRVKWPLELAWFGGPGPARMDDTHYLMPMPRIANGRYFVVGMDHIIAVDAYNGCELWARKIPHVFLGWSSYAWRRTHGVGGAASGGTSKVLHSMSADDENLYLNFGEVCYALDAQTGRQKKVYGSFRTGERYPLLKPQSFEMALEKDVAGTIKLKSTSTELELTLTTPPPKPRRPRDTDDHWDLFFDFRPPLERGNLYEPGVLQIKVNLPELKWENVVGPDRPKLAVTGKKSPVGNEVVVTLPWEGIASLAGARPKSFGFAAILNRWDGRTRTMQRKRGMRLSLAALDRFHKFADDKAYAFNNGWATFVLGAEGSRAARPAAPGGKLADLPKRALEWGRMPRRGKGHTFFAAGRRHPLSGQMTRRTYVRAKHCGARIASSATMDFFRSGTVGLYDLADDSGTRSFGGIRPGCHPNMIPAFGILIYSEASSGCRCAYNFHTSFALVPARKRKNEDWAVFHTFPESSPTLKQAALNLGAPGDRRDERGVLWLGYPRPEGEWRTWRGKYRMSLPVPIHLETSEGLGAYRFNSDRLDIRGTERPWIYASGYRGIKRAVLETPAGGSQAELRSYTVRLHFAEPDDAKPGERVLDVKLQGKTVLANLDVVKAAGGPNRALVREFKNVPVKENLTLELIGRTKAPTILSGIEVALE